MAIVSKAQKGKERHLPLGLRPAVQLGHAIRKVREDRHLSQRELAAKIGSHFSQVSLIENGANVEVQWYERVARALGFKDSLELFNSGGDDLSRRMFRLWRRLPDDEARREVLKVMQRVIVADVESDAT